MHLLRGHLLGVRKDPDYTNKETGEVSKGKTKAELLVKVPMKNGEIKNELYSISIPASKVEHYRSKIGKEAEIEVAVIGKVTFYGI